MKKLLGTCVGFFAASLLIPGLAAADQPILLQRCNVDSLDPAQAAARLAWARRCALVSHVNNPMANFDTEIPAITVVDSYTTLQDYREDSQATNFWGLNAYSAQVDAYEVNSSYIGKLYNSAGTSQGKDPETYFNWWRSATRRKTRPLYPTFGSLSDINSASNVQLFPHPNANNPNLATPTTDCRLFTNATGTVVHAGNFYINGFCESSCYTPEQEVLFSDGYAPIVEATAARRDDMMVLSPESSLENVRLEKGRTYAYTAEFRDSVHPIVEFKTASGASLRVTVTHPVVTGDGRVVAAQTLKEGDELLRHDGTADRILSAVHTTHFGKVYNLRPTTSDRVSNLLVAEGFVVGSSLFQNDEVDFLNRIILHRVVPIEVIP